VQRVCWLSGASSRGGQPYYVAFVDRLAKQGFVEGQNLAIEFRAAEGHADRLPRLAADLERQSCDVFLAPGSEPTLLAVKQVSRDTPIVMMAADYDPVAKGHVKSLAKPGGRITGVHVLQTALIEKRIEVLKELLPQAKRFGVLSDVATIDQLSAAAAAAKRVGIELQVYEFKKAPYDYEAAFAAFQRAKVDAVLPLGSQFFATARKQVTELALKYRLPGVFNHSLWAEAGGLLSYGTSFSDMFSRAADQISKILKGANPAEIPVEQPTVVELVINMKTAKALGITVPQGVWFRAERVIE
jgi:putative ABC transport system substrate-binding protein